MELRFAIKSLKKLVCICTGAFALLLTAMQNGQAQIYTIKNGSMYIEINKDISEPALDSFINHYGLTDIAIRYFIKTNLTDSFKITGWNLNKNDHASFAITKAFISADDLTNLSDKLIFAEKQPGNPDMFPATNNGVFYGYNKFTNKLPFATADSFVIFYLRKNLHAGKMMLAGSFNNWQPDALPMTKTDSGWIASVKLPPGKYLYKFIADGHWMIDEDNLHRENDGRGNTNSVFYKTNYIFRLQGYADAKKVYLAGSFNSWRPKELLMNHTAAGWELPIYLANGTHTYKYVIDDNWKTDPSNPERLPNEFNDFNSVIRLGKAHIFRLNAHKEAKEVVLSGSFNGWRTDELYMAKTGTGWELPYTLGPGNYEYRFVVDGKEISDPGNTPVANSKKAVSYLILEPNHTFRLKGYPNAKSVFLAGDFNNFSPDSFAMLKDGDDWVFNVHLPLGKHLYKFVVDNQWIRDPDNKLWEQNQFETGDSVIWIEE